MGGLLTGRWVICKTVFWTLSNSQANFSTAGAQARALQRFAQHRAGMPQHFRNFLKKSLGKSKKHAY
jgi:hypothetical protein